MAPAMVTDPYEQPPPPRSSPPSGQGPVDPLLRLPSFLVFELIRTARRTSLALFPDEHLRQPHAAVLACLADLGPMSQREVSKLLRYDPGDLVGVIDALEELKYVVRGRDTRDRRRYSLQLTDAGRLALHERRNRGVRLNEALFAPLTAYERDQLQDLLLRVLAHHDPRYASGQPSPGHGGGAITRGGAAASDAVTSCPGEPGEQPLGRGSAGDRSTRPV